MDTYFNKVDTQMNKYSKTLILVISIIVSVFNTKAEDSMPEWIEGMLDIHTISTGRGNCQFIILPDGTTMMIDAGDFDGEAYDKKYAPMRCTPLDGSSKSAAQTIADYVGSLKGNFNKGIDYFLLTHFHSDHYGALRDGLSYHKEGGYYLTGLTELAEYMPIRMLVDRDYPNYNFPIALKGRMKKGKPLDPTFDNYLAFADYTAQKQGMQREGFELGKSQFKLKNNSRKYPSFHIQNIKKSNLLFRDDKIQDLFSAEEFLNGGSSFSENPLSCAIVINYGKFRYFAGGDNTGLIDQDHRSCLDIETPMAEVIGKVTAMSLNHHGNRDATNLNFLNALDPEVVILQSWSSDHPGQEVAHRLISPNVGNHERKIFMTDCDPMTGIGIGPWFEKSLTGKNCHMLLRVMPDGAYQTYTFNR